MASVRKTDLSAGENTITLNLQELGLPVNHYAYQLQVENSNGVFRQAKMMTAV